MNLKDIKSNSSSNIGEGNKIVRKNSLKKTYMSGGPEASLNPKMVSAIFLVGENNHDLARAGFVFFVRWKVDFFFLTYKHKAISAMRI